MAGTKNGTTILHGNQNLTDRLWDVELNPTTNLVNLVTIHTLPRLHVIISKSTSLTELIQFYQVCFFYPSKSTLMRAAQHGNFITWLGLNPHNIAKHFTMTMATAKGHLNQEQKNLQSTIYKADTYTW